MSRFVLNSCGFVEHVIFLFSLGKKVNHLISIKLGNKALSRALYCVYGALLNELPE